MLGVPAEGVCAVKRWTFAGFFRIAIDVLQLAFVDFFNKCAPRPPARGASLAARNAFSLSLARASHRFKKLVAAKASPRALVQPAGARRSSARLDRVGKTPQLM